LRANHRHASVVESEQRLRIVVEDLVRIRLGQPQPLDVSEGLLISLVILQHRVVAAGYQMVGAKGFEGAEERRPSSRSRRCRSRIFGSDARGLGEVRVAVLISIFGVTGRLRMCLAKPNYS
jgi:hypothetical protein